MQMSIQASTPIDTVQCATMYSKYTDYDSRFTFDMPCLHIAEKANGITQMLQTSIKLPQPGDQTMISLNLVSLCKI